MSAKPFATWVVFGGLFYFGLAVLVYSIPIVSGGGGFGIVLLIFAAIPILASFAGFTGKRWGFAVAAGVSAAFLVIFGLSGAILSSPVSPFFWVGFSGLPILLLVAAFSILSLWHAKTGLARKPYLASPRSAGGLVTLAVVGFVIGGLLVGNIAATTINRLLDEAGQSADVRIVRDAASTAADPFMPATLPIAVGDSVTWFNGDTMVHTITSDTGAFDSPSLAPGESFTFTFTQPGTYAYHCTPHPWMQGAVVVQP